MSGPLTMTKARWGHLTTFVAEGLVLVATVLVYKLAADRLGDQGFESYTIVRRTTSFLQTIAMCGLAVAIVRYVAMAITKERQVGLLRVALKRLSLISVGMLVIAEVIPAPLSGVFFGSSDHASLILPIALLASGLLFHTLAHGYLRGNGMATRSNLLQAVNLALVPNGAMLWAGGLEQVLWATGLSWVCISGMVLLRSAWAAPGMHDPEDAARMIRFGTLRLPGDMVFASLLSLPVFLVNHVEGISTGASIAFAITLINVAGAAYSPLSLILLPSVASMLARRQWKDLRQQIIRVSGFVLGSGVVMVVLFELVATPLLRAYLGPVGVQMEPICRVVFLGAGMYGVHVSLRSILDAYHNAPRNTFNLFWALVVLVSAGLLYTWGLPVWWSAAILVLAPLTVLASLTLRDVHWIIKDLRAKQAEGTAMLVLEPVAADLKDAVGAGPDVRWVKLPLPSGGGFPGAFVRAIAIRREERRSHPEFIAVREDPASALLYAFILRAPLVLITGASPGRWDRWASLIALRVICPTSAAMEYLQGWATSVRQSGRLDEKGILSLLLEAEVTEAQ
jgi:O-antigen/teichoic acid export membrane protein